MQTRMAAKVFAELGNPTRLEILRFLIKTGRDGLSIGEIQRRMKVPLSTLAFHLRGLVEAQLVEQEKFGRTVMCRPRFDTVNNAITFLKDECCSSTYVTVSRRKAS